MGRTRELDLEAVPELHSVTVHNTTTLIHRPHFHDPWDRVSHDSKSLDSNLLNTDHNRSLTFPLWLADNSVPIIIFTASVLIFRNVMAEVCDGDDKQVAVLWLLRMASSSLSSFRTSCSKHTTGLHLTYFIQLLHLHKTWQHSGCAVSCRMQCNACW